MLERPDIPDQRIVAHLRSAYGVDALEVEFLPLGADVDTAVYRVRIADAADLFFKRRTGVFDEIAVTAPALLHARGIGAIIPPRVTQSGRLWASMDGAATIVYPFIVGHDGYEVALTDAQWVEFGATMRSIHDALLPPELARQIPREDFSPRSRQQVRELMTRAEHDSFQDPVAARMAEFIRVRRDEIGHLVARADELGCALRARSGEMILCHADIHAGNLLISAAGDLYIVDWDNPIFAPRERDLMWIGGDGVGVWHGARAETLFYRGYGSAEIDPLALAYYRYARIIEDIAAFGEQLLLTDAGGADREQSYGYFAEMFEPGHEADVARRTDAWA